MPTVPQIRRDAQPLQNIPGIGTPRADPEAFGASLGDAISRAGAQTMDALASVIGQRQRVKQRKDAEAADEAALAYDSWASRSWHGDTDPATGQATPGLSSRRSTAAEGVAADFSKLESDWLNSPESPYAKLNPDAQTIFRQHHARISARYRETAARHELSQMQARREEQATAALESTRATAIRDIDQPADLWEPAAGEAALRAADLKTLGRFTLNPDGSRAFASAADQTAHRDAAASELAALRKTRALHFADAAALAGLDPEGQAAADNALAEAESSAAALDPLNAADVRRAAANAAAHRKTRASASLREADIADARAREADRSQTDQTWQQAMLDASRGALDADTAINALRSRSDTAYANARIADVLSLQSRIAEARAQAGEKQAKADQTARGEIRDANVRHSIAQLDTGHTLDESGNLHPVSSSERRALATRLFIAGDLSETQWQARLTNIARDSDARVSSFTGRALRELLPDMPEAFAPDPFGNIAPDPAALRKRGKSPDDRTGLRRQWFDAQAKTPRAREESLTFSHVADALNVVREQLALDPSMTQDDALKRLRELTSGTLADHRSRQISAALAKEQETLLNLQRRLIQATLSDQPAPAKPAPKP